MYTFQIGENLGCGIKVKKHPMLWWDSILEDMYMDKDFQCRE